MSTRIVCVGNELVRDDGLGMRVGRVLGQLELPPEVQVVLAADVGLDLIDTVLGSHKLVLVDATRTACPPGTLQVMPHQALESLAQSPCCCHALGLAELLRLAERLEPSQVPTEVVLVGVEAEVLDQFGTTLSPAVQEALPDAVAEVLRQAGASAELIEMGRAQARTLAAWEPTVLEAYGG